MKRKQLLLLLGTLIVLLGVAYVSDVFNDNVTTFEAPKVSFPTDDVDRLTIELPTDSVSLVRQGARWLLQSPVEAMGDSVTIERFLRDLGDIRLESVASNNPARYARYGVDSTATTVTATAGGVVQRLVVSLQGPDYQSIYVRLGDDPRVYATRGRLSVPQQLDRWRHKLIVNLPAHGVASVSVASPDGMFEARLGETGWEINGAQADSAAVATWLRRFGPMNADGFFDDIPPQVLTDATYQLAFNTTAGATEILRFMKHAGAVALTNAEAKVTYRLVESKLATLFPDPASLQ